MFIGEERGRVIVGVFASIEFVVVFVAASKGCEYEFSRNGERNVEISLQKIGVCSRIVGT